MIPAEIDPAGARRGHHCAAAVDLRRMRVEPAVVTDTRAQLVGSVPRFQSAKESTRATTERASIPRQLSQNA